MMKSSWEKIILFIPEMYVFNRFTEYYLKPQFIPHACSYLATDFTHSCWITDSMIQCELWTPYPREMIEALGKFQDRRKEIFIVYRKNHGLVLPYKNESKVNPYSEIGLSENFSFKDKPRSYLVFNKDYNALELMPEIPASPSGEFR